MSEKIQQLSEHVLPTPAIVPTTQPNIFQRVLSVMEDLKFIAKGSNKVNGQYSFVSHDDVAASLHPLLVKHRIAIIPTVEDMKQDNNRTIMRLTMCFINVDCPSDCFTIHSMGYGVDNGDKGPGKAFSYAYKYGCLKTFCLETGDDPDNDANAFYEPAKCLEFDAILPSDMTDKDKQKLKKFLAHSSQSLKKHVEDVKREAVKRPEDFLKSFANFKSQK